MGVQGHFSLRKSGKTTIMERKEFVRPEIEIVKINPNDLIATSDPTGETDPWGEG